MTLAETIYQRSLRLPEAAAREALDFIEFLEMRYGKEAQSPDTVEAPRNNRRAGSAAGRLVIVSDDHAHLEDFKDYMP